MQKLVRFAALCAAMALIVGCGASLSKEDATILLKNSPDVDFSKTIIVDLGFLNAHCGQPPSTAKYLLLQKTGAISIKPGSLATEVVTTAKGDQLFKEVGAQRMDTTKYTMVTGQQNCNVGTWAVPIATREMMNVTVTPTGDDTADVTYSWMWKPNQLGEAFTVNGDSFKSLPTKSQDDLRTDGELPLDNGLPHATKVKFVHDGTGWHVAKSEQP